MWMEWGIGRNGGRYRKGHLPGMFAAIWKHPAAKYLGILGMVIPLVILIYYTVLESWTPAYTVFSLTGGYAEYRTPEAMQGYLTSYRLRNDSSVHQPWVPFAFFHVKLALNIWILSRGISGGHRAAGADRDAGRSGSRCWHSSRSSSSCGSSSRRTHGARCARAPTCASRASSSS